MNHMTSGASNDIERATDIAQHMVCEWGMSALGMRAFRKAGNTFEGDKNHAMSEAAGAPRRRGDREDPERRLRPRAGPPQPQPRGGEGDRRGAARQSKRSTPTSSRSCSRERARAHRMLVRCPMADIRRPRCEPPASRRSSFVVGSLLLLTVVYAVLQVGFVQASPAGRCPTPNLARPPVISTGNPRGARRPGATAIARARPRLPCGRTTRPAGRARTSAWSSRCSSSRSRRSSCSSCAARSDGAVVRPGARAERRGRRRAAARRRSTAGRSGLGHVLTVFAWLAGPLAFPIIALAILHFPSPSPLLARHRWLYAVPFVAAAPMLVLATATSLYLVGVDGDARPGAVGRGASGRLLRVVRARARHQRARARRGRATAIQLQPRRERAPADPDGGLHRRSRRDRLRDEGRRPDRRAAGRRRRCRSIPGRSPRSCSSWCCCRRSA